LPYTRLTPFFGVEPQTANIGVAEKLSLATAIGLWKLCEDAFGKHHTIQAGGLAHGDAELHNLIVCPTPLEVVMIDFEGSVSQSAVDESAWQKRCALDLVPLLREALYLQCILGQQDGPLGELSRARVAELVDNPEKFLRAIELRASEG
jgi:hypothetical protein